MPVGSAAKRQDAIDRLKHTLGELKNNVFSPVYLVCGNEEYFVRNLTRHIISTIKKRFEIEDVEMFIVDHEFLCKEDDADTHSIVSALSTVGTLFDKSRKIIWVHMCDELFSAGSDDGAEGPTGRGRGKRRKEYAEALAAALDRIDDASFHIVFSMYSSPRKTGKLYNSIKARGSIIELERFREYEAKKVYEYISASFLRTRKKTMAEKVFFLLIGYTGLDIQKICMEIEKLVLYTGSRSEITEADVRVLLSETKENVLYDLQDNFGSRRKQTYAKELKALFAEGVSVNEIIGAIFSRVQTLREAKRLAHVERLEMSHFKGLPYFEVDRIITGLKDNYRSSGPDDLYGYKSYGRLLSKKTKYIEKMLLQSDSFTERQLESFIEKLVYLDHAAKRTNPIGAEGLYLILESC